MNNNIDIKKSNFSVSIIVPVYNVEKFLSECIESIISQLYTYWELILVDDGSLDSSGKICDEYARMDSRIKVIHKKNGGVSSARNCALEVIHGDYVTFVDADDCLYNDALKVFIGYVEKSNLDLVQCCYNRKFISGQCIGKISNVMLPADFVKSKNLQVCVWVGMIKSSIIKENNIRFNENVRLGEDQIFIYECLAYSRRVQHIPNVLYFYRDNDLSAVHNPKDEYLIASLKAFSSLKEKMELASEQCDKMFVEFFIFLSRSPEMSVEDVTKLFCNIKLQSRNFMTFKVWIIFYLYKISIPFTVLFVKALSKMHMI